nr:hypothetical protein [Tanacetum cinerariifolium]
MSPRLSAGIEEVAAMPDLAFHKRFRSSYGSSPSPTLPVRKRYRGTSKLILGIDSEEIDESSDSNSESKDAEDESPTTEDEDPTARDEVLTAGVEGPSVNDASYGLDDESYGLDDESHCVDDESHGLDEEGHGIESDGLVLGEEEVVPEAPPVQTLPSPNWMPGSLPISPSLSVIPSPVSSPMIPLTVPSPIALPMATSTATILVDEDQFIEERTAMTFWSFVEALDRFIARAAGDDGSCDYVGAGEGP